MQAEHDPQLSPEERRLAAQLRATLDDAPLDLVTNARLAAARRRALDAATPKHRAPLWAGAAVAAGLVAVLAFNLRPAVEPAATPGFDEDGLEWIALAEEAPEFYEDLEFYEWLDDETHDG
jgi:hypothetical protein